MASSTILPMDSVHIDNVWRTTFQDDQMIFVGSTIGDIEKSEKDMKGDSGKDLKSLVDYPD